jgi:hypothetical protein
MRYQEREFLRLWLTGYVNPAKLVDGLADRPAPHWGLYAQSLRALMVSFLLYLPLFLVGRTPPTPSNLSFVPADRYYGALVWLAPIVFAAQWLLAGSVMHLVIRLSGRPSDLDQILNITGMGTLVVGAFLVIWDWAWILIGGLDQYWLGYSHLLIDVWGVVIAVVGLKRLLRVPVWLGVAAYVLALLSAVPMAVMFMRSPL